MAVSAELRADPIRPPPSTADGLWSRLNVLPRLLYWGTHAACLGALWVGVGSGDLVLLAATFFGRMFAITAGYHRYFSHRTFRTGPRWLTRPHATGPDSVPRSRAGLPEAALAWGVQRPRLGAFSVRAGDLRGCFQLVNGR